MARKSKDLSDSEKHEITTLIRRGVDNLTIAEQFDISEFSVSAYKAIATMRDTGYLLPAKPQKRRKKVGA